MTKPETALSAVVERTFPLSEFGDDLHDYLQRGLRDVLYADLTALISEHYYPKEFLLWTHSQDYWLFDSLACLWVSDEPSAFQEEKTTDELFNYWEENER